MSCSSCNNSNGPLIVGGLGNLLPPINPPCSSVLCNPVDAKCTIYTGGNLACSGINTKDSLELALQKIDTLLCASSANYSTYQTYCLAPIATQQQFVEAISQFTCNLNTSFLAFINTTFPAYQTAVSNSFAAIQTPGTTSCSNINLQSGDSIQTVLQKFSTSLCDIYENQLDISSADWNQCFTVSPLPTTLAEGFDVLIDQICTIKDNGTTLPPFNNTGSCLPSPGTADSLVDTINKIKTRLCQSPTLNINTLTWNCVSKPSINATDLQGSLANILAKIDVLSQAMPTFSGDFSQVATNPSDVCAGKTIGLSATIADRKVAATATDGTPGTLQDKLVQGTNITLDFTDPTKVTINSTASSTGSDGKVFADSSDSTPDFLSSKLENSIPNSGLSLTFSVDSTSAYHKVQPILGVDAITLFTTLLNAVSTDNGLKDLLCSVISSCPSPCAAPTNVSVIYGGTTSSTTTTTTTSGPTTSTTTTTSTTGVPTTTTSSTTTTTTTVVPTTTTTTTSTSTTTSSTTTTTTTLDSIFVGAQAGGTPPNAATVAAGTLTMQLGSADVAANWVPFNATPQFCWVGIPSKGGTYNKTKWFDTITNQGNIGTPSDLFDAPTTVTISGQPYHVYITTFATQFAEGTLMQA